jgi:hypothetical protein
MSTWHQDQQRTVLYHATHWTVVIDPPNKFRAVYRTRTKALAAVYMRSLKANNPEDARYAYILPPSRK